MTAGAVFGSPRGTRAVGRIQTFACRHAVYQAIGQLRPYAVKDPNARAHLLNMLEKLNEAVADPEHRASIDVERRRVAPGVATDGQ